MDTDKADGQTFANPKDIHRLLSTLQSKLAPLSISIEHSQQLYTSYALQCDKDAQTLLLDELVPKEGSKLILEGHRFSFESFVDGCRIRAKDLTAKPSKQAEGETLFQVDYPSEVHFLQRRKSYRAPVRKTLKIPVQLVTKQRQEHQALLRDFSLEGCQLELSGDLRTQMVVDHSPIYARLKFPNSHELRLKVLLLRLRYDEVLKVSLLGCRFAQLTTVQIKEIGLINNELQRDHINFVKNGGHVSGIPTLFLPLDAQANFDDEDDEDDEANDDKGIGDDAPSVAYSRPVSAPTPPMPDARPVEAPDLLVSMQTLVNRFTDLLDAGDNLDFSQLQAIVTPLLRVDNRTAFTAMIGQRKASNQLACHLLNCGYLMAEAATLMGKAEQRRQWCLAGLCHNLACLGMPTHFMTADRQNLSNDDLLAYRQQLQLLLQQAQQQQLGNEVLVAMAEHRARLDGSGFPSQLNQDSLHQLGKLMAIVSYYDSHSYQCDQLCFFTPGAAFKELLNHPHQFDRAFLKLLISLVGLQPLGSSVRLNNDLAGIIIEQNALRQPARIRVLYNLAENQRMLPADVMLNEEGMQVINLLDAKAYGMAQQYLKDLVN